MTPVIRRSRGFVSLWFIIAILGPFGGVSVDVVPFLTVVVLTAYHVLVKGALPNVITRRFSAPTASETVVAGVPDGPRCVIRERDVRRPSPTEEIYVHNVGAANSRPQPVDKVPIGSAKALSMGTLLC